MPNTLREHADLGISIESTWGQASPNFTGARRLLVEPGEWLRDVIDEWRDELPRNVLARDYNSIPTVGRGEGTLRGPWTPVMPGYLLQSVFGASTISGLNTGANAATGMAIHDFTIAAEPDFLSITQHDNIAEEQFLGMIVSSFTIRFTTGEGPVEWEAEFIGRGRTFPATARSITYHPSYVTTPPRPLIGAMALTDINGNTTAKVLDFEMVISREIELAYGAGNARRPNIIRASTPRVTFRATAEFQVESDITKYSNDVGSNSSNAQAASYTFNQPSATYFDSNLDTWHVRIATDPDILTTHTPLPTTAVTNGTVVIGTIGTEFTTGADSHRGLIDLYLDRVTYASDPIVVDRGETTSTIQFNGVATYDTTDTRIGVFRVINEKNATLYSGDGMLD